MQNRSINITHFVFNLYYSNRNENHPFYLITKKPIELYLIFKF